jgi:GT2 family glycosyltransferase
MISSEHVASPLSRAAATLCGKSSDEEYQAWIDTFEPTDTELREQIERSRAFLYRPLFSVVVPVYNVREDFLNDCVNSVLQQTYDNWELCIAYAPASENDNSTLLRDLSQRDERIRLIELDENRGISHNSNAALSIASGDLVVLLDNDDVLAPFALFALASSLETTRETDILYSDHDYLDGQDSHRKLPLFKPDWSPDIMLSANYITHLTAIRRSLLDTIGLFDPETDGAQDWDLFLRASAATDKIHHIPQILYHWRMHAHSTAHNSGAKAYVAEAQLKTLRKHIQSWEIEMHPEILPNGLLHVRPAKVPDGLVSVIIPTKDHCDLLRRCIDSLLETTTGQAIEIIIIDNQSKEAETKRYLEQLQADERIRVIWYPGSFNYSTVNNIGAREAQGEYLLFLNNDVEFTNSDWLVELKTWAQLKPIGVVGAKLLRQSGVIQHAGVILGMHGFAEHPFADQPALTFELAGSTGWYRNYLAVTGACMLFRREVFEELGGFDEHFVLCGSDVEICLRAHRAGYRVLLNPFAELIHHEQQTRDNKVPSVDYTESFKHYGIWLLRGDPYWNPNLSLWSRAPKFRSTDEPTSLSFCLRHLDYLATPAHAARAAGKQAAQEEQFISRWFDCGEEQLERFKKHARTARAQTEARSILWFLPAFENPFFGGVHTILRFAEHWRETYGVTNYFAICGTGSLPEMPSRLSKVVKHLNPTHVYHVNSLNDASSLPPVDASICTLWTTAYYAINHLKSGRYFYFLQDYEPAFYRAGAASAVVETTYRMGLYGIANTVSVKDFYEREFGGRAMHFDPCVDTAVFSPVETAATHRGGAPWTVFFYGRPGHARNAFELLSVAMQRVKERLGDRVRILSAGAEWDPAEYGLQGVVDNLGLLTYEESARVYRQIDLGVVMMLTRHPSYIPFELMASGALVVTNVNSWTSWLLRDHENCLLSNSTASAFAETIYKGLVDYEMRRRVIENALRLVRSRYSDWRGQMDKVYRWVCDPNTFS